MRIPPPDPSSLDPDVAALLDLARAPSGDTAQTIAALAHSPGLVGPFLTWAMALHADGVLSKRLHEIVALRVAHRCGSTYEWDEHTRWATDAGLTPAEIESIATDGDDWSPMDKAAIAAVDELHATQDLTDTTLANLRSHVGDAEVIEIIMVVGQYTMLSMLATTVGDDVRPDDPTSSSRPI